MHRQKKHLGKRIFLGIVIFMIPILIAYLLLRENMDMDLTKGTVRGVSVVIEEKETLLEGKDEVEFFCKIATGGEAVHGAANDTETYRLVNVVFHKSGVDAPYCFYLSDSVNDCLYTDPENNWFLIPSDLASELLSHPVIVGYAVSFADYPKVTLTQNQKSFEPALTEGEWNYTKTDGSFSRAEVEDRREAVVILPKGEAIKPVFGIQPDLCTFVLTGNQIKTVSGNLSELPYLDLPQDTYLTLNLSCKWTKADHKDYYGELEYTFRIFYDVPTSYEISASSVKPGDTVTLRIRHSSSDTVAVNPTFAAGEAVIVREEDGFLITVPVSETAPPGNFSIMVMGSDVEHTFPVAVLPG